MPKRGSFICPSCGEEVPVGARSCPECGADEKTGWSENTAYDGVDIPDTEEMDYESILEKEGLATPRRSGRDWTWIIVAAVLVIVTILAFVFLR